MRAVNLIPEDLQGGTPGRTGGSVYVLLGALAVLVVLVAVVAVFDREVAERRGEVARAESEARTAEAKAATLVGYQRVAQLRQERSTAVTELSRKRFNWSYAMREISGALPKDVWLVSLTGSAGGPAAGAPPAEGTAAAAPTPKIDIVGCTIDQDDVARYLATLRSVDGVTRVGLSQTTKDTEEAASAEGGQECPAQAKAKFTAAVFFENAAAPTAAGAPSGDGAAAPAGQAAAPAPAPADGAAQPATSTTTTPAQPAEQPGGAK